MCSRMASGTPCWLTLTTGAPPRGSTRFRCRGGSPWNVFRATVGVIGGQAMRPIVRKSLPLIFLLSCCHALGETVGILAGPGKVPPACGDGRRTRATAFLRPAADCPCNALLHSLRGRRRATAPGRLGAPGGSRPRRHRADPRLCSQRDFGSRTGAGLPARERINGVEVVRVHPGGSPLLALHEWWISRRGGWRSTSWFLGEEFEFQWGRPSGLSTLIPLLRLPADIVATVNWCFGVPYWSRFPLSLRRIPGGGADPAHRSSLGAAGGVPVHVQGLRCGDRAQRGGSKPYPWRGCRGRRGRRRRSGPGAIRRSRWRFDPAKPPARRRTGRRLCRETGPSQGSPDPDRCDAAGLAGKSRTSCSCWRPRRASGRSCCCAPRGPRAG